MKNESGDMFCGNCGTKLEVQLSQPAPGPQPNIAPAQKADIVTTPTNPEQGQSHATASLVLGIIAVVCWFFGYSAVISLVCGFIGITLAGKAKEEGFEGGTRTAGFILSLIGLIGGAVILIACVACVGSLGILGSSIY